MTSLPVLTFPICPFQATFQHPFNCATSDIADQVAAQQCFTIEFEDIGVYRYMSLRFWRGAELGRVFVCRNSHPSTDLAGSWGPCRYSCLSCPPRQRSWPFQDVPLTWSALLTLRVLRMRVTLLFPL